MNLKPITDITPGLNRLFFAVITIGIICLLAMRATAATLVLSVRESTSSNVPPTYIAQFDTISKAVTKFPAIPPAYLVGEYGGKLMHDIASTPDGNISFMTGMYSDVSLVTYNQMSSAWSNSQLLPGWAVNSNGTSGGVTSFENTVYIADMGNPGGVIETGAFQTTGRRTGPVKPIDISYNAGKIYSLNGNGSPRNQIEILDIESGIMSYLNLSTWEDYRAVAVTQDSIYVATWSGDILHLSHQGTVLGSMRVNIPRVLPTIFANARFNDIDIAPNGVDIALGTADGFVVTTTTALSSYSYTDVIPLNTGGNVFVAWKQVPEPSSSMIILLCGIAFALKRRRRR